MVDETKTHFISKIATPILGELLRSVPAYIIEFPRFQDSTGSNITTLASNQETNIIVVSKGSTIRNISYRRIIHLNIIIRDGIFFISIFSETVGND